MDKEIKTEFIKVFDCTNCHCLSNCHDENHCNLGYNVDLLWRKDRELIYCSTECELNSVTFGDSIFIRDETEATSDRPENWKL